MAVACKIADEDNKTTEGIRVSNSDNPVRELNKENPKHVMDKPALEIVSGMNNGVFCDVTPCGSCKNRRFGRTQRPHH
jgi:hypothetical protein